MRQINPDDYEGHTPGPWERHDDEIIQADGDRSIIATVEYRHVDVGYKTEDAILITDAPLLLEEVKELRAWKAEVERICRTMNGPSRDTALFIMTNEVEEE